MFNLDHTSLIIAITTGVILTVGFILSLRILLWSIAKNKHNYQYYHSRQDSRLDNLPDNRIDNQIPEQQDYADARFNPHSIYYQLPTNPLSDSNQNPLKPVNELEASQLDTNNLEQLTALDPLKRSLADNHNLTNDWQYQPCFIDPQTGKSLYQSEEFNNAGIEDNNFSLGNTEINGLDSSNQLYSIAQPQSFLSDPQSDNLYFDQQKYDAYCAQREAMHK